MCTINKQHKNLANKGTNKDNDIVEGKMLSRKSSMITLRLITSANNNIPSVVPQLNCLYQIEIYMFSLHTKNPNELEGKIS